MLGEVMFMVGILLCVVVGAAITVLLIHFGYLMQSSAPFVRTPKAVMGAVMEALKLPERGLFYDLGCGDGRVLAAVGQRRPALRLVGVDHNLVLLRWAGWRLSRRATLMQARAKNVKLFGAIRVYVFLGPSLMADLEEKFKRELPAGARVVCMQFPLPKRLPVQEIELANGPDFANKLFVYDY